MPAVKSAAFRCPECGQPTRVKRTRAATQTQLTRYRECDAGHRFTTKEIASNEPAPTERAIGTTRVEFALHKMVEELGIQLGSDGSSNDPNDNSLANKISANTDR